MHQCLRSPTTAHERGGGLPAIFSPRMLVSILAENKNEPTCFRLGNGTTSLRSWPGHVGPSSRLDPLPPGVFIYP